MDKHAVQCPYCEAAFEVEAKTSEGTQLSICPKCDQMVEVRWIPRSNKPHYTYQVNLHFGDRQVSAFRSPDDLIVGRGVGDCLRKVVKKHHIPAEQVTFTFQPED